MKRKKVLAFSLVVGLALAGLVPGAGAEDTISNVVIFATNSIDLNTSSDVLSGDIVVNAVATGPTIGSVELEVGQRVTTMQGDLKAHRILIKRRAVVTGDVFFDELDNDGTIIGNEFPGSSPPYANAPPFQQALLRDEAEDSRCSVTTAQVCTVDADCPTGETCEPPPPGTGEDVDIPDFGFAELPAGDYGDIRVGVGATALFSGGLYNVRSIDGGGESQILFDGPSDVRIDTTFLTANNSVVGPASGSGVSASEIILYVAGENDDSDPETFPFAAKVGNFSDVDVNFYVPNGTLRLKRATDATGAFLARDVHIERDVQLSLDSAFVNQGPTAFAQEVLSDGASDLVITLEGSDPEGGDLSFSIEVDPTEGTLSATITPIIPAAIDQCSQSGESCLLDSDCPGFAEGETCDTVQPPITQATVTYTPNLNNGCVTDPESGEVTCPEDFFTFGVTDDCGDLGTAIVSVNGGTDEAVLDPGICSVSTTAECFLDSDCPLFPAETCLLFGVVAVAANDLEVDVIVDEVRTITLSAEAPAAVASLTFRIETLPAGTLADSDSNEIAAIDLPYDLPSPVVVYAAPATAQTTSFSYSARDSLTTGSPCGSPSCDTAVANIDIGNAPELAPDQAVETDLNTSVEITLRANAGGTSGAPPPPLTSPVTKVTYGDNGPPMTTYQLDRLEALMDASASGSRAPAPLSLKLITVDGGWDQFSWCDIATSPLCNDLVDLVNESPVIEGPFDFTNTEDSCLRVTDTLAKGDHWRVENLDGGNVDWTDFTSEVDQSTVGTTGDPDVAFGDLSYSHGEFDISAGTFSIRLTTIPPNSFAFGTAGYIRVDTGPCVDIVWEIISLPAPANGTLTNLDGSLVQIGDTYLSQPTVVFTPSFGISGTTSFEYQVTQGATVGIGVVDTAIVDLLVSATDSCGLVGREVGCAPGS